jgi:serine/threonine protein kinase
VEHTWTKSGWIDEVPYLFETGRFDRRTDVIARLNTFSLTAAVTVMLVISLTSLILFLAARRKRAAGWLSVQTGTASVIALFELGGTQLVLGTLDITFALVPLAAAMISAVYTTHNKFDLGRVPWIWPVVMGAEIAVAAVFHGSFAASSYLVQVTLFILAGGFTYQIFVATRLVLRPDRPPLAWEACVAWYALAICCAPDIMTWLGLGELFGGVQLKGYGLTSFCVLEFAALTRDYVMAIEKGEELNVQLNLRVEEAERSQREIAALNEEMRRQVGDRSRQLFAALVMADRKLDRAPRLRIGEVLQKRYRVLRRVGVGGMSMIYEAQRLSDNLPVALKVPKGLRGRDLARLAREAQIMSQLRHPNLVTVYDVDITSSGRFYLVLEYLQGQSLSQHRPRFGELRWGLMVMHQVAQGLAVIHQHGIVHRDLKPSNVLLTDSDGGEPRVKITDFGISRMGFSREDRRPDAADQVRPRTLPGARDREEQTPATASLPEQRKLHPHATETTASGPVPQPGVVRGIAAHDAVTEAVPVPAPVTPPAAGSQESDSRGTPDSWRSPSHGSGSGGSGGGHSTSDSENPDQVTRAGVISGTPMFVAPELVDRPETVAPECDMFSFGVMAYRVLTGVNPFAEPVLTSLVNGREVAEPESLAGFHPGLDPEVVAALDACLSLHPEERPSAAEVAEVVGRWLDVSGPPGEEPAAGEESVGG